MFAPRTAGPLYAGVAFLALWASFTLARVLPHSPAVYLLLALASALWAFLLWFFRDPEREVGPEIVAGADGRVLSVERDSEWLEIRVFMGVTNVHVNRFPISGRVTRVEDGGRGFAPAYTSTASANVQRRYHLATRIGAVELLQVTGLVARRLVSFVREGEEHAKGERLGMIVLGSRFDIRLPAERVEALVAAGAITRAGVTPIARELPPR
ncbi:MAG: phosphatidylserine decarboxylase [Thermoplasmata archaeon]|nr:phosphatidylserine decarboxylase [Thermoplasmata archaeon]